MLIIYIAMHAALTQVLCDLCCDMRSVHFIHNINGGNNGG